jgi:hypothetical protein
MGRAFDSQRRNKALRTALVVGSLTIGAFLWGGTNHAAPKQEAVQQASTPVVLNAAVLGVKKSETADETSLLPLPNAPSREWRVVASKFWQIAGPVGEDPAVTDAREQNRGACAPGMIEVKGKMKQHALLDDLQLQACTSWIDRKWPERCGAYDREKWLALAKELPTKEQRFCIDRFEYPNRKGEFPIIMVSWYEARDACKAEGKRLCSEDEWTFACEGEEATPYPNGYVREADACVNDRPWKAFHGEQMTPRTGENAKRELDRLWQGLPSGSRPACKSSFGVYDMTGNVDEWTRSSIAGERPSVLKGGYWGPVRTRCRPATKAHGEEHTFYQQGFRCCGDPAQ